ncbi:hypothetical protein B6N38_07345 [Cutibacterium avidum]|nr:hypothetical protein B6N38_07345 [Cutibacterium avidum]
MRKWVVVVLPLVPVTLATRRSASSSGKARGANVIVTRPRIDAPEPLPARREAVAAVLPASRASCSRGEVRCLPGDEVMVPIMAGRGDGPGVICRRRGGFYGLQKLVDKVVRCCSRWVSGNLSGTRVTVISVSYEGLTSAGRGGA